MKKRYIALAGGGSFFAMAIAGFAILQADINACNAGDEKVCKELAKTQWDNSLVRSEIKTGVFFAEAAKYEKQAKGNWNDRQRAAKKDTFHVNTASVGNLAYDCEKNHIRPFLKDPNSFRELNHTYKETVDRIYVQVNYTATNGFGGRVQESKTCNYTL